MRETFTVGLLLVFLAASDQQLIGSGCSRFFDLQSSCTCIPSAHGMSVICEGSQTSYAIETLKTLGGSLTIDTLSIRNSGIDTLYPNAFAPLRIRRILLDDNSIHTVYPAAFASMTDTEEISLAGNQLDSVPAQALLGLPRLQKLNLACNRIQSLDGPILANLTHILELDLSCNEICDIHHLAFYGIRASLEVLNLQNNCLGKIPNKAFAGLNKLKVLNLGDNEIEALDSFDLVSLQALQAVKLSRNRIRRLESLAIADVPNLREVLLDNNEIFDLNAGLFSAMQSVRLLDLSYNEIETLEPNVFAEIRRAQQLTLTGNRIHTVHPLAFGVSSLVTNVKLDENCIDSIEENQFYGLKNLEYLSLARNNLQSLAAELFFLHENLKVVDMSDNFVQELPKGFAYGSALIILSENPIVCETGLHVYQFGQGTRLLDQNDRVCRSERGKQPTCPTRTDKDRTPIDCCVSRNATLALTQELTRRFRPTNILGATPSNIDLGIDPVIPTASSLFGISGRPTNINQPGPFPFQTHGLGQEHLLSQQQQFGSPENIFGGNQPHNQQIGSESIFGSLANMFGQTSNARTQQSRPVNLPGILGFNILRRLLPTQEPERQSVSSSFPNSAFSTRPVSPLDLFNVQQPPDESLRTTNFFQRNLESNALGHNPREGSVVDHLLQGNEYEKFLQQWELEQRAKALSSQQAFGESLGKLPPSLRETILGSQSSRLGFPTAQAQVSSNGLGFPNPQSHSNVLGFPQTHFPSNNFGETQFGFPQQQPAQGLFGQQSTGGQQAFFGLPPLNALLSQGSGALISLASQALFNSEPQPETVDSSQQFAQLPTDTTIEDEPHKVEHIKLKDSVIESKRPSQYRYEDHAVKQGDQKIYIIRADAVEAAAE